jgi:3-oxoacyl-[acyl-carrier protein] reductase
MRLLMTESAKELANRVAIVTGSGRNIGRAIALSLAAGGACVVVNARGNKAEADAVVVEIEKSGGKAFAVLGDVAESATAEKLANAAVKHFGRVDFLINNAAIRAEKPIDALSYEDWRRILSVILDGAFHNVKAAMPHLKKSGAGAIVNLGGLSAHSGSKDRAHVMTAKAGIVGFTRALAADLAADNVTVNCVVPGLINTKRSAIAPEPQHHSVHRTLTGQRGTPEDIAATVRFLCGPGARYITGQTIHVNGGAYLGS